ncbi:MAG: ATP-binding protein [Candidatus Bathyarchaeota archaeon]|nr:ATP-binding protein [Candidatus Bathyarchaeota archaeon]
MGLKSLFEMGKLKVWQDVFDPRVDQKSAPDLSDVVESRGEKIYCDPDEFFSRTYLTHEMSGLIEEAAETLRCEQGGGVYLLTSLYGGGKTHTLITLYHAFKSPQSLARVNEKLARAVKAAGTPLVVVIDGSRSDMTPHPQQPYVTGDFTIKTLWGMLAYKLGAYAKIRHLDDGKKPCPDIRALEEMFSQVKEPVVILLDEIVHYIFNMSKSADLQDYGQKVLLFLDYLARVVEKTPRVVLVAAVQAEYREVAGQKQLFEEETFKGYAGSVLRNMARSSSRLIAPVPPGDIVNVLKKRLFQEIPVDEASNARDRLYQSYKAYPELFGAEADWQFSAEATGRAVTAKDTWPFHPKYLEVLHEVISRSRELQKTRDVVRITRKVVRKLLTTSNVDADYVMPWHIDLADADINISILTEGRREFRNVASKDIINSDGKLGLIAECAKPSLALKIATAILLKTHVYETFKEPLKVFPDLKETALMTYEAETFALNKWQPQDIASTLEEMPSKLRHFNMQGGRFWFDPYRSVLEHVEKRAEDILAGPRGELYNILRARINNILVYAPRKGLPEKGDFFTEQGVIIRTFTDYVKPWPVDDAKPKLVIVVEPQVDKDEVEQLIFNVEGGGKRVYRNTVAVLMPNPKVNFEDLLHTAAKLKAVEDVEAEIRDYYPDEEVRKIQQEKLKNYRQSNESSLDEKLLAAYTLIAYPTQENDFDTVKQAETQAANSLIAQAEAGLRDTRTGPKLRVQVSFSELTSFLMNKAKISIGDKPIEYGRIAEIFATAAYSPFVTRDVIEQAIREGLENLEVAVKIHGVLHWKSLDGTAEQPQGKLRDDAEIIGYKQAAKELQSKLASESGTRQQAGKVIITYYTVEYGQQQIRIEDLPQYPCWEDILKTALIQRHEQVIMQGFALTATPSTVIAMPGQAANVQVEVTPVGGYQHKIKLEVSDGTITPPEAAPPLKAEWQLPARTSPGNVEYTIKCVGEDGYSAQAKVTVQIKSPEESIIVDRLNVGHVGAKLAEVTVEKFVDAQLAFDMASKLGIKNCRAELNVDYEGKASFASTDLNVDLTRLFAQKLSEIARTLPTLKVKVHGALTFTEPVTLDEQKITAFNMLGEAKYKLIVRRQ